MAAVKEVYGICSADDSKQNKYEGEDSGDVSMVEAVKDPCHSDCLSCHSLAV